MLSDCKQAARSLQIGASCKKNMNPFCDNPVLMEEDKRVNGQLREVSMIQEDPYEQTDKSPEVAIG